ncbi:MAG: ABC transporter substrate-binding protein [Halomonas sp.]|nr:ABC transporter substrate-binding protein [Halomonas sp.]MCC5900869.1 ABC transporter substrate-binding protein [Halomonas sp.]
MRVTRFLPTWLNLVSLTLAIISSAPSFAAASAADELADVTLRVAVYKGGDQLRLEAAGLLDTPYQIEWREFGAGSQMLEAINANAIDFASGSETPPVFAAHGNADFRLVAALKNDVNHQVVLVPEDSEITSIEELAGKRVGYVRGTTTHYYLLQMLDEAGLGFEDIDPRNLSPTDGAAAFSRGDLDAWAIYGYSVPLTQQLTGARVLKTAAGYLSGNFLYYANTSALEDPAKSAAIADFLERLQRSYQWQNENEEEFASLQSNEIRVPEDVILSMFHNKSQPAEVTGVTTEALESAQDVADVFAHFGVLSSPVDLTPYWDDRFNARLASEHEGPAL